jgi:diacylglycerol kinase family enzyme
MGALPEQQHGSVSLGAIGLGSSNDFHKPLRPDGVIEGIPCTIDFSSARPRDVAMLEVGRNGATERRFFLINASAGLTAEANRFFNGQDALLAFLKRTSTNAAILYAAFRTMATYRDRRLIIEPEGGQRTEASVTNLAIVKNPHVSGGLRFPGEASYDSGLLQLHLAGELGLGGRLRLFRALASGRAPTGRTIHSWQSREVTIRSQSPFGLEFDGEVINTDHVRFSVLPRHLRVCTC